MKKAAALSILFVWVLLAVAAIAEAQKPKTKTPVIGILRSEAPSAHAAEHDVFWKALRERGYDDGKNIIAGGKIWVESERDKGSTFTFTLPITATG